MPASYSREITSTSASSRPGGHWRRDCGKSCSPGRSAHGLDSAEAVLHAAIRNGILHEPTLGVVDQLKRHWIIALSPEPLPREVAVESLSVVRHVLAVTPVISHNHRVTPEPAGGRPGDGRA